MGWRPCCRRCTKRSAEPLRDRARLGSLSRIDFGLRVGPSSTPSSTVRLCQRPGTQTRRRTGACPFAAQLPQPFLVLLLELATTTSVDGRPGCGRQRRARNGTQTTRSRIR